RETGLLPFTTTPLTGTSFSPFPQPPPVRTQSATKTRPRRRYTVLITASCSATPRSRELDHLPVIRVHEKDHRGGRCAAGNAIDGAVAEGNHPPPRMGRAVGPATLGEELRGVMHGQSHIREEETGRAAPAGAGGVAAHGRLVVPPGARV